MVKVSNKKRALADKVNSNKPADKKQGINPFEVHINKQKHQILGQKLKNDRGLPGVSRAKAIKKRKHTLLQEYNVINKSNKFVDRRIGEKNFNMTAEDKQMARFTAERMKMHNKKSIYNLADEEVLTHRGQTLSEIEKFDDPRSEDEDDEDEHNRMHKSGKLDDNFVEDAHFGGGILKKTTADGAKSHKELIEQLIAESKKRKAEKQKIREQTIELTEKLDTEWKDLLPLMNKSKRDQSDVPEKKVIDSYDKVMRELKFEARGQPTDRLKSEEEIAKEEKERLEKLEQDRINRMKGVEESTKPVVNHRSADDLDDNFAYDSDPEFTLAYNEDGTCIMKPEEPEKGEESDKDEASEEEEEEEASEEEESNDEDEDEDNFSDLKESESESSEDEIIMTENEEKSITPQKRKIEETTKQDNSVKKQKIQQMCTNDKNKKSVKDDIIEAISETQKIDKELNSETKKQKPIAEKENKKSFVEELLIKEKLKEEAAKELPYTFKLPENYEELQTLLIGQTPEAQSVIMERMIKCNHPSSTNTNKESIGRLLAYLLQYLYDVSSEAKKSFAILNNLLPHLYDLAHLNKESAHEAFIELIKEKHGDYIKDVKKYPGIDLLLFLKVIGCLFPTSDFRHQVTTPTMIFLMQMLTTCRIKNRYDISYGLFLVTMVLEYTSLSKRFVSPAVNYLAGLIHMAIPKTGVQLIKVIPPFKRTGTLLVMTKKSKLNTMDLRMTSDDLIKEEIDDSFRIRVVYNAVKLIEAFYENYSSFSSCDEIFRPHLNYLEKLPATFYPDEVQTAVENVINIISNGMKNRRLEYLLVPEKKPKALRLYEPSIVKIVEGKNHKVMSKEKAEKSKLIHKYKKEMKGALREIRRDKSFLGRVKLKERIQSDRERKEKVNKIFAEASVQQSELNAIGRKKKSQKR